MSTANNFFTKESHDANVDQSLLIIMMNERSDIMQILQNAAEYTLLPPSLIPHRTLVYLSWIHGENANFVFVILTL
jgi:hypothetical protein